MKFKLSNEPSKLTDWIQAISALFGIIGVVVGFWKLIDENNEQNKQIINLSKIAEQAEKQAISLDSLARETAKLAKENKKQTITLTEQIVKLDSSNIHLGEQAKSLKKQNTILSNAAENQRKQDQDSYDLAKEDLDQRIKSDSERLEIELKSFKEQLNQTKDFNRRTSLPNLVARIQPIRNSGKFGEYKYRILVTNDGLGPAKINSVSYSINGEPVDQKIKQIATQLRLGYGWITSDLNKGTSILPGEEHVFLELGRRKKVSVDDHNFFEERMKQIGMMIFYESIYRDSCQAKLNRYPEDEINCFDLYD
ncbi:MAG: hypothetical protein R8G66_21695 [Cytophagales bacterium]|nr:hypothetical protein [Cytophagales bacterium]